MPDISLKKNNYNYIAFFDLDLTLTGKVSGKLLVKEGLKKGILSPLMLLKALTLQVLYILRLREPVRIMEQMSFWIKGLSSATVSELCAELFNRTLFPSIFPQAIDEINMHKRNGAVIVILSSSIRPVCSLVAEALGIDDILCTELEMIDDHYTGEVSGRFCYGHEKAEKMKIYCEKNNRSTRSAWYYGDSVSDLPVFRLSGNPVCINPSRKLKKYALAEGWSIKFWKMK